MRSNSASVTLRASDSKKRRCGGLASLAPRPSPRRRRAVDGFTLLELVLVLGIVAVGAGAAVGALRPSSEMRAANALRALLTSARHEALLRGHAVAVVQVPGGFVGRSQSGSEAQCGGGAELGRLSLADHQGVQVLESWPSGGLVWLPSGSGRTCAGGGVISSTVVLRGWRGSAAVVVSSLGRVRVERR